MRHDGTVQLSSAQHTSTMSWLISTKSIFLSVLMPYLTFFRIERPVPVLLETIIYTVFSVVVARTETPLKKQV
jgi:hypothetical protein